MTQASNINTTKTLENFLKRLDDLTQEIRELKEKLPEEPLYGSEKWWEKEIEEADNAFNKGDSLNFDSSEDAIKWLKS